MDRHLGTKFSTTGKTSSKLPSIICKELFAQKIIIAFTTKNQIVKSKENAPPNPGCWGIVLKDKSREIPRSTRRR